MVFYFYSKYKKYFIASVQSEITSDHVAFEIIKKLEDLKFKYKIQTYIPSQKDKKYFFELFERKINARLLSRKDDKNVEALLLDGWPTKNVNWKTQNLVLLTTYDRILLKWIYHYEVFHRSYLENMFIYIDFYDEMAPNFTLKKEQIDEINKNLAINDNVSVSKLSIETKIERNKLIENMLLYKKFGLIIFDENNLISLSDRGKRLLNSNYKQKF